MSSAQATPPVQGAKLPTRTVVAYSFGDVANNLSFQMTSMFLLMYMTNVAGISAAMAETIYNFSHLTFWIIAPTTLMITNGPFWRQLMCSR